jgi:hypothetical protein
VRRALAVVAWVLVRVAAVFGIGVRVLDHRRVDDDTYDATRWLTILFLPVVPLGSFRIRPRVATSTNLGAVIETTYQAELLGRVRTTAARVIRMYLLGWLVAPIVMLGPVAAGLVFANLHDDGRPSPLKSALLVAGCLWCVVAVGILDHRRERLYAGRVPAPPGVG